MHFSPPFPMNQNGFPTKSALKFLKEGRNRQENVSPNLKFAKRPSTGEQMRQHRARIKGPKKTTLQEDNEHGGKKKALIQLHCWLPTYQREQAPRPPEAQRRCRWRRRGRRRPWMQRQPPERKPWAAEPLHWPRAGSRAAAARR